MCGINGIVHYRSTGKATEDMLECMNQKIYHRGPDAGGCFVEEYDDLVVGMAMRRLSIIDINGGKQPQSSEEGHIVIVLNGEIYNYRELREALLKEGVKFTTKSDTEVVLKLYEKLGTDSFRLLDGMFAFSILDKRKNKIFIARDFFGEKPLYYTNNQQQFIWASELKSIISVFDRQPQIDITALNLYFQLTYIPAPYTIYESVKKLEPNHYIELDIDNLNVDIHLIHQQGPKQDNILRFEDARKAVRSLVEESVISRSVSDVPLGTFLSGGVDSSIVSFVLAKDKEQKIDTFSIGFEKQSFDETDKSQCIARLIGSNHHEFIIGEKDLENEMENILLNFDEPFADSSALPSFLVASKTRQYVKVALTGDGGDEVFGGYNKYYMGKINHRYTSLIPDNLHQNLVKIADKLLTGSDDRRGKRFKARRLIHAVNYDGEFYYDIISLAFQQKEMGELFSQAWKRQGIWEYYKSKVNNRSKSVTDFRNIDKILSLEGDMLVKVDRTSMLTSLECRAPFLNKKLWDFASCLPDDYLIRGWSKKYILKKAFEEYFPKGFLDKSKKGFGIPVGDWLRGHLKNELEEFVNVIFLKTQGIFNVSYVKSMVENHLSGKVDNTFRVWTFYCFQKWYKNVYVTKNL